MDKIGDIVEGILERGYAVFPMQEKLGTMFKSVQASLGEITPEERESFSFPDRLDGFLPFGQEHAENKPDLPDLCERFCYFRKNRTDHAKHPISSTPFYNLIAQCELGLSSLSKFVLSELFRRLGGPMPEALGADSYIQLCNYNADDGAMEHGRYYLMDPHIDGQLLTFTAQTEQGLKLKGPSGMESVSFSSTELFVMAGKLLEMATDGDVKALLHGVARNESGKPRLSLMYFQNPCFEAKLYKSLREGRSIDFLAIANDIHRSYGNLSYVT
jgi:hypothetical protein